MKRLIRQSEFNDVEKIVSTIQEDGKTIVDTKEVLDQVEAKLNELNIEHFVFEVSPNKFSVELDIPEA
jgi:hypothetical protein